MVERVARTIVPGWIAPLARHRAGAGQPQHDLAQQSNNQNLSLTFCNLPGRRRYPKRALDTLDHRAGITWNTGATKQLEGFLATKTRTCAGGSTYVIPSGYQGHLH